MSAPALKQTHAHVLLSLSGCCYRPLGKVMFSEASVSNSVYGGGGYRVSIHGGLRPGRRSPSGYLNDGRTVCIGYIGGTQRVL